MQRRFLRSLVDRQVYECLAVDRDVARPPGAVSRDASVQVRMVERCELARHSAGADLGVSKVFLRGLVRSGDLCFGAFAGDALVSYVFCAPVSPTAIDEALRFQFPAGWIYVYKAFTLPEWRGKRLLPHLLTHSMRCLGPSGFVALVDSGNHASRRAFQRCGFRTMQRFPVWRVLSRPLPVTVYGEVAFSIEAPGPRMVAQV